MNDWIKAGADIHADDGGYSEGTKEGYEAFVKLRKDNAIKSLAQEAGFCFFSPEEDAEEPIDWSCDYEQEFFVPGPKQSSLLRSDQGGRHIKDIAGNTGGGA